MKPALQPETIRSILSDHGIASAIVGRNVLALTYDYADRSGRITTEPREVYVDVTYLTVRELADTLGDLRNRDPFTLADLDDETISLGADATMVRRSA